MSSYVVVSGTSEKSPGAIHFARRDLAYNLRLAGKRKDKRTYVRMLRLKSHVNYAIRMTDQTGHPCISIRRETWRNGKQVYVVRDINGHFKAVI